MVRWMKVWLSLMLFSLMGMPALHAQTVEYIHTDALGSPVAVTNSTGVVVERREYEPYGKQTQPALANGPGYTGHVSDAATGLDYMQQRYYDPGIGRFLSVDPVVTDGNAGTNFNRYKYANNNPYKFTDPDGRESANVTLGLPWNNSGGTFAEKASALAGMAGLLIGGMGGGTAVTAIAGEVSQFGVAGAALANAGAINGAAVGTAEAVAGTSLGTSGARGAALADDALVVRGGSSAGANSAGGIAKGTGTHPSGVTGFSAESANGASLCALCKNVTNNQVGVSTTGQIRAAGGDVVSTGGRSPNHATVTGLSPEKAAATFNVQPNPVPPAERNF